MVPEEKKEDDVEMRTNLQEVYDIEIKEKLKHGEMVDKVL